MQSERTQQSVQPAMYRNDEIKPSDLPVAPDIVWWSFWKDRVENTSQSIKESPSSVSVATGDKGVPIEVHVRLFLATEVSLSDSTFRAKIQLTAKLPKELLHGEVLYSQQGKLGVQSKNWFVPMFTPRLIFPNLVQETYRSQWFRTTENNSVLLHVMELLGTFALNLDTFFYPFDYHILKVDISTDWSNDLVALNKNKRVAPEVADRDNAYHLLLKSNSKSLVRTFVLEQSVLEKEQDSVGSKIGNANVSTGANAHGNTHASTGANTQANANTVIETSDRNANPAQHAFKYSVLSISMGVTRKWWQAEFFPVLIPISISILSLVVFGIGVDRETKLISRIEVLLALLLTQAVTLAGKRTPFVSIIDIVNLFSFLFILIATCVSGGMAGESERLDDMDPSEADTIVKRLQSADDKFFISMCAFLTLFPLSIFATILFGKCEKFKGGKYFPKWGQKGDKKGRLEGQGEGEGGEFTPRVHSD